MIKKHENGNSFLRGGGGGEEERGVSEEVKTLGEAPPLLNYRLPNYQKLMQFSYSVTPPSPSFWNCPWHLFWEREGGASPPSMHPAPLSYKQQLKAIVFGTCPGLALEHMIVYSQLKCTCNTTLE